MRFFSQHNPAKNEIYQIRGSGSINSRITALRSSFNEMITQDFKITKYFNAVFKIYGNVVALLSLLFNPGISELPICNFQHNIEAML